MEQAYVLLNNVKNELKEKLLPAQYNTIFNEITEIYKVQGGNIYLIVANISTGKNIFITNERNSK